MKAKALNKPYIYSELPYNENLSDRVTYGLGIDEYFSLPEMLPKVPTNLTMSNFFGNVPSIQLFLRPKAVTKVGR